jgi:hypothetical protein
MFAVIRARRTLTAFIARCAVATPSGPRRCRSRWCSGARSRCVRRVSVEKGKRISKDYFGRVAPTQLRGHEGDLRDSIALPAWLLQIASFAIPIAGVTSTV